MIWSTYVLLTCRGCCCSLPFDCIGSVELFQRCLDCVLIWGTSAVLLMKSQQNFLWVWYHLAASCCRLQEKQFHLQIQHMGSENYEIIVDCHIINNSSSFLLSLTKYLQWNSQNVSLFRILKGLILFIQTIHTTLYDGFMVDALLSTENVIVGSCFGWRVAWMSANGMDFILKGIFVIIKSLSC